jgi:biotin carboxyl carrier protein
MIDPAAPSHNNTESRRRSWLWLILIGVVIVAAVFVAALMAVVRTNNAPTAAAGTDPLNFADVVMADLTQEEEFNGKLESIKASGSTLIPAAQVDLAFDTPGPVAELLVQVGQEVKAGDVLARVDATTLAAQDEIAVAQAQINVVNEIAQLGGSVKYGCDPNWHRTGKVYAACQLLGPGAECPFVEPPGRGPPGTRFGRRRAVVPGPAPCRRGPNHSPYGR